MLPAGTTSMCNSTKSILLINLAIAGFMLAGTYAARTLVPSYDWLPQMIIWFGISASFGCGSFTPRRRKCCRVLN